jgi:hypothetical protein
VTRGPVHKLEPTNVSPFANKLSAKRSGNFKLIPTISTLYKRGFQTAWYISFLSHQLQLHDLSRTEIPYDKIIIKMESAISHLKISEDGMAKTAIPALA